jgi:hypothetical protein
MSVRDPILERLGLIYQRTLLFVILFIVQSIAIWVLFWTEYGDTWFAALVRLWNDWPFPPITFDSIQAVPLFWIGFLQTFLIYREAGRWWKKKTEISHRRGSRFTDE